MKELIKEMEAAMMAEYERAASIHGPKHASAHEAYAVILEERDEAIAELAQVGCALGSFWENTKANKDTSEAARTVMERAIKAAAEHIQVGVVAYKALLGYERP